MQTRKLSYLAIDRLGELLGLTADALSPIYDLRSAILQSTQKSQKYIIGMFIIQLPNVEKGLLQFKTIRIRVLR